MSSDDSKVKVNVDKLEECTGDCDIAMRKGKIITIYDMKLVLGFSGTLTDDEETKVDGKITIPEVMHDNDEDDYVFETEVFSETKEKSAARDVIKSKIVPRIRSALQAFPTALTDAHGKDVLIAFQAGQTPVVGTAGNAQNAEASATKAPAKSATSQRSLNVSSISETYEFQTLAKELYITFLDQQRLAAFTRAAPVMEAKVGGKYSLFNGNVQGEILALEENVKIVQTWRLQAWPAQHYAKLTLTFDQGLDGTNLRMTMSDIPVGQEDAVKHNFGECMPSRNDLANKQIMLNPSNKHSALVYHCRHNPFLTTSIITSTSIESIDVNQVTPLPRPRSADVGRSAAESTLSLVFHPPPLDGSNEDTDHVDGYIRFPVNTLFVTPVHIRHRQIETSTLIVLVAELNSAYSQRDRLIRNRRQGRV